MSCPGQTAFLIQGQKGALDSVRSCGFSPVAAISRLPGMPGGDIINHESGSVLWGTSSEIQKEGWSVNTLKREASNGRMVTKLLFRLLPIQILLALISAVNGIVSSLFASNFIGEQAMSAVAIFGPINMLVNAFSMMFVSGATILCGKYIGRNQLDKVQHVFSLDIALSLAVSIVGTVLVLSIAVFDLSGFLTQDADVRPIFNRYLLGQAPGVLPFFLGNQLSAFLSLENKMRRTTIASLVLIVCNVLFNFLFVRVLRMGTFGLALASSLAIWIFFVIEVQYFFTPKSSLRFVFQQLPWQESGEIVKIGFPGAATFVYQTLRGLSVNHLVTLFVGSIGLSAFAASDSVLRLFWAIPTGMLAVSRMLISISIGEEDRQTLTDVMRNMFYHFLPLMCAVSALIIALAVPFTKLFFRDPSAPVFMMTVWGFRILPLCMPLSIICMHFTCYGEASGKHALVHILSLLDGVICVTGFTALLIRWLGMNSVYVANVLNGVVTTAVIVAYSWIRNRRFPKTMEELMVIPKTFGVPESERLDLSVVNMGGVVTIAQKVEAFCLEKGLDARRAVLAGLALEEMAGNVVDHGFKKDRKKHSVDVRVVHKDDGVILRIKDDCVPFDPAERKKISEPDDPAKNIGIRMVYQIAKDMQYQNILGLNVLTMRF